MNPRGAGEAMKGTDFPRGPSEDHDASSTPKPARHRPLEGGPGLGQGRVQAKR